MPKETLSSAKSPIDTKVIVGVLLVLTAVIISSVNLGMSLSRNQKISVTEKNQENSTANSKSETAPTNNLPDKITTEEQKLASLLVKQPNYSLPFGAAEIEAYYTTVEAETTLNGSGPTVTCSALVVVDGPKMLMDALTDTKFGAPPTIIIGSENSSWTGVNESTKENPVKLLVTLGSSFEGESIGCMSVVFDTFTQIK